MKTIRHSTLDGLSQYAETDTLSNTLDLVEAVAAAASCLSFIFSGATGVTVLTPLGVGVVCVTLIVRLFAGRPTLRSVWWLAVAAIPLYILAYEVFFDTSRQGLDCTSI